MKHGSLFSGIGGFDLAAEWMGWENVFHCEWEDFPQKILKYYWPNSISYGDITKTDFTIHRGEIDVLSGGFPCQPYSAAGKRLGTEDDRHLWPEMLRAIREIAPTWVVGENVFGLVNWSGGLVFEEVQADLEAEGYEVQPYVLPAAGVNAPHRRDRIWFVAYSRCIGTRTKNKSERTSDNIAGCGSNENIGSKNNSRKVWFAPDTPGDAVTGQNREGIEVERAGIAINDQGRGRQLKAVQHKGLDDISRDAPDTGLLGQEVGKEQAARTEQCDKGTPPDTTEQGREERQQDNGRQDAEKDRPGMDNRPERFGEFRDAPDTDSRRQSGQEYRQKESGRITEESVSDHWQNFPTQPPVCSRDDGVPDRLDGITFPKWRNESIKAMGNAVVPQVVYQIFKAIEDFNRIRK